MNEIFLENHLRLLYKFLGHEGYTSRIGSLDYSTGKYENVFLKSENEVINYARRWNGQRNIFISRAFRNPDGSVNGVRCVSFDVDPIRPKGEAANDQQHSNALAAGRRILEVHSGGYLASSGNGCLLLYRVPPIADFSQHYARESVLIKELQKLVEGLDVKIDSTNYDEAVIKAIGTQSTKGVMELRRVSRFIDFPIRPFRESEKLLQRLNEIVPEPSLAIKGVDIRELRSRYNGDRSTADYHLVNYLKKSGVEASTALKLLEENPLGRKDDEKDQTRLITKIYGADSLLPSGSEGNSKSANYFERLFAPKQVSDNDITTGLRSLDMALGVLPKAELTTIAARSGYGKTSWACTLSEHLRKQGKRVLYFSTEMQKEYIMHKLVSIACNIPQQNLLEKSFTESDKERIKEYEQQLLLSSITLCDEFQPTIELVQAQIVQHKPDVMIFDHISQVDTSWQNVATFVRKLKDLTAKESITTVVMSLLNEPGRGKNGEEAVSIRGDVRGSQEIIFLSAIFSLITNSYSTKGTLQPVEFNIAKNRYGISGITVPLSVNKETGLFQSRVEVKEDHGEPDLS